jgi:hypothetical protein
VLNNNACERQEVVQCCKQCALETTLQKEGAKEPLTVFKSAFAAMLLLLITSYTVYCWSVR